MLEGVLKRVLRAVFGGGSDISSTNPLSINSASGGTVMIKGEEIDLTVDGTGEVYGGELIDFGLAPGEKILILGVEMWVAIAYPATTGYVLGEICLSLDPTDAPAGWPSSHDNNHFAFCSVQLQNTGAITSQTHTGHREIYNFVGMNLVATQNLAFLAYGWGLTNVSGFYKIYYKII